MVSPKYKPGIKITAYLDNFLYERINEKARLYNVKGITWKYHPSSPGKTPITLNSLYELRDNLSKVLNSALCDTYHSHDNIQNVDSVKEKYRCLHDYVDSVDVGHDNDDNVDSGYDSIDYDDNFKTDHAILSTYDQAHDNDKSVTRKYHCLSHDAVDSDDSKKYDYYYSDSVDSRDSVQSRVTSYNGDDADNVVDALYNQTCEYNIHPPCVVDSKDNVDNIDGDFYDNAKDYTVHSVDADYGDYKDQKVDNVQSDDWDIFKWI